MAVDLASKSLADIRTLIQNHERLNKTAAPLCRAAFEELARRTVGGLSINRTIEIIAGAARERRFISYGQIAVEYGMAAGRAKLIIPKHLEDVNDHAKRRQLPLLSAIVVSKDHLQDGLMDAATLEGFRKSAERLGMTVDDPAQFLQEQQEAVFAAAHEGRLA